VIVDLFGGAGGWAEGCRILGLAEVGLEWDDAACRTRAAAGHQVIRTDVARYPTAPFQGRITGLLASAPCQAWSRAGKGLGLIDQPLVHQAVTDLSEGRDTRAELLAKCRDERSLLAAEPMRWLYDLRPQWVAMEEVPDVLPLWRQYARMLRGWGYSVWTGILNAADYGVPQTRQRAILIASRVRRVSRPEPTHAEAADEATLFGPARQRWVSMAEALGWASAGVINTRGNRSTPGGNEFSADRPSWALTEKTRSWVRTNSGNGYAHDYERDTDEPSPSITSRVNRWELHTNRDQRPDGSRQVVDPSARPAPTVTAKSGGQWVLRAGDRQRHTTRAEDEPAATLVFGNSGNNGVDWVLRSGQSVGGEGRAERGADEPSVTITGRADLCTWRLRNNTQANASRRGLDEPAGTLFFGDPRHVVAACTEEQRPGGQVREDSVRIAVEEAAVLQSFRSDYPWQGTKTKKFEQIGNAWCPRAAAAVIGAAAGLDWVGAVEREYGAPGGLERVA
jgi:DNA (cytosine-5)-methyltransferase 1